MDKQEFADRAQTMRERLYRTAYGYLGNPHDSLDAVDEAVYQGFRARRSLRQPAYFETWLTRILMNVCVKQLRRQARVELTDVPPETAAPPSDHLPLREAIRSLPEDLRQVIILRYFTGLTLSETAAALGIPQGTAATRQRRALALLRIELEEDAI